MKKIHIFSLVALFFAFGIVACKKDKYLESAYIPESLSTFAGQSTSPYYVQNVTGDKFKIPVGITTLKDADTKITYSISSPSGAASGVQYSVVNSGSLTIPAGKSVDSITVNGLFAGFPGSRRDTLIFKLTGGDLPPSSFNNTYTLVLTKSCPVILTSLAGAYPNTREFNAAGAFQYGPYSTSVINLVSTSATTATCQLTNFYDDGWPALNATFDWTNPNPTTFKVIIPAQATGKVYSGLPASVRSSTAAGAVSTFNSCDNTVTTAIDIFSGSTVIVSNYVISLRR
jgi:hypothetical protein